MEVVARALHGRNHRYELELWAKTFFGLPSLLAIVYCLAGTVDSFLRFHSGIVAESLVQKLRESMLMLVDNLTSRVTDLLGRGMPVVNESVRARCQKLATPSLPDASGDPPEKGKQLPGSLESPIQNFANNAASSSLGQNGSDGMTISACEVLFKNPLLKFRNEMRGRPAYDQKYRL